LKREHEVLLIGLTGSIGMGKSQTARLFEERGVPVYDADATVHALYGKGGDAVEPVGALFPDVIVDGAVDRVKLSSHVVNDAAALKKLEAVVHPLAGQAQLKFLRHHLDKGTPAVVLDIPLLLETGAQDRVDVVVLVSAPFETQRQRVLQRPNMTEEKFNAIVAKQMPDAAKRQHADFIVDSSISVDDARRQVGDILQALDGRMGKALAQRLKQT
jgi:dephospho-CoA kinase